MRLWLSKNSEVPIREQLVTQIILGIVSNDLKISERLPSTRDLARRYDIHANTVSAAYRELARRGWVVFRKGSGVYVRARTSDKLDELALDQLVARFFRQLREDGHALAEIQDAVRRSFSLQRPDHFLLLESDPELREILSAEISSAANVKVKGIGPADLDGGGASLTGAAPLVLYGHLQHFGARIDPQTEVLVLHSASVVESMKGQTRPPADALVAIVSRWPEFLKWARTMLVAAGLEPDALSFRDARERGWEKGLRSATFVITDSLMATRIPAGCEVKVFRVLAESSLREINEYAKRFF
ncbi:MAG TPA: GntR family transcriptional regulator [Pyrinomonadaceae bacterium]|jgi:GntR family transcriptional regulator|nr:GntR family transcriptional regulator [Pyrinomonadaceae bacterium]